MFVKKQCHGEIVNFILSNNFCRYFVSSIIRYIDFKVTVIKFQSAIQTTIGNRNIKYFIHQNNSWQLLSTKLFSRCLKWNRFIRLCLRIYLIQKVRYILWHKIVLQKPASSNTASTSSNKQHQTVSWKDVLILLTICDDTIVVVPRYFSSYYHLLMILLRHNRIYQQLRFLIM